MNISDEKKIEILLSGLKERYESLHKIRERVHSIGIWTLGLLIGASGWVIQGDKIFSFEEKLLFILGIIVSLFVLQFYYLRDLKKGFVGQQKVASDIEKTLGFYEKKFFCDNEVPIYPERWSRAGTEDGGGKFFDTTQKLLWAGAIFLGLVILFNGSSIQSQNNPYYKQYYHHCFFR